MTDRLLTSDLVSRLREHAPQAGHYGAHGIGVLLEQAADELERLPTGFMERLRKAINHELPRTHKGFRCQYEQDQVMRALDRAFASVSEERNG